ncbi:MAG: malonyl-ACP O-methyltransferase BioC [Pseudomonadota bacterium]
MTEKPIRKPSSLDQRAARHHFSRAAQHYDEAAVIQREIADRLLEKLDILKIQPRHVLEAGCGTGYSLPSLHQRYTEADIWALDFALPMLQTARHQITQRTSLLKRLLSRDRYRWLTADLANIPLPSAKIDLLISSLALQWSSDRLPDVFAEWHRVLALQGAVFFATLGPDTLKEVREAFSRIDNNQSHIHRFVDMHDIGDELVHAGFADPVMEMETLTIQYSNPKQLFTDLKTLGAVNADINRPKGLMGKERWKNLLTAWESAGKNGVWNVTYEVIYGHAWKIAPKFPEGVSPLQFYPKDSLKK